MVSFYSASSHLWLSSEDIADHVHEVEHSSQTQGQLLPVRTKCASQGLPLDSKPCHSLYGRSVRRAALDGIDASQSATSPQYRLKRLLLNATGVEDLLLALDSCMSEFDSFHCTLAVHRLARYARTAQASLVSGHRQWPHLSARLYDAVRIGEPRQVASIAWALANLRFRDGSLLDAIADRCVRRGPGHEWDSMSLSLIPQSFAMLDAQSALLFGSISAQMQREMSTHWHPSDVSRFAWACARLLRQDDALFRDASCKAISRLTEFSPAILAQCVWAFAHVAPSIVTSHLFPRVAERLEGNSLADHTPAHLAMPVWAFAAVLFRPVPLLEKLGDEIPSKSQQLNSQDITMIAWSYAALLAPQRRVFPCLAPLASRTIHSFNSQDLSNTAWAFATAGEYAPDMMNTIGDEACRRASGFNGQHLAMLIWAFVTLRHGHSHLFRIIGDMVHVDKKSWHSAKLLAYALAGLPRLHLELGSRTSTLRVATEILEAFHDRACSDTSEADDAHTVHDAVYAWLNPLTVGLELPDPSAWHEVDAAVSRQRQQVRALAASPAVDAVLAVPWSVYEPGTVREYQLAVQALGIRGLGSLHTWKLLEELGIRRGEPSLPQLAAGARLHQLPGLLGREPGRGERANWCFWRAHVELAEPGGGVLAVAEPGRLQNSAVVAHREDTAGLVAVMMSHDHVSHRAWDCEFRVMARTAAAARALLSGLPLSEAQACLEDGSARDSKVEQGTRSKDMMGYEKDVCGRLEVYMTEVPCLSCVCAMIQFRRRFQNISMEMSWDGMPPST